MELAAWEVVVLILAGLAGGFINVMAGGGSVITVPVMIFLGVPGPIANGTNRLPILAHNISAAVTYLRHGLPQWGMILSLSLCAIPGASSRRPDRRSHSDRSLQPDSGRRDGRGTATDALGAGAPKPRRHRAISGRRRLIGHVLMVAAGFWGGFIQIGMGFILLPILQSSPGARFSRSQHPQSVYHFGVYGVGAAGVWQSTAAAVVDWRDYGNRQYRWRLARRKADPAWWRGHHSPGGDLCHRRHDSETDMVPLTNRPRSGVTMINWTTRAR